MESRKCRGVYLTGELLNVDGDCGGYNLHWAWSTGWPPDAFARSLLNAGGQNDGLSNCRYSFAAGQDDGGPVQSRGETAGSRRGKCGI
ncbi:MAG: hypothetical protein ACLVDB_05285 [Anaeromassilibacillus sp.]